MKYNFIVYLDLFEKAFVNGKKIKHLKKNSFVWYCL